MIKSLKSPLNLLLFCLVILNILPFLAPIFMHFHLDFLAKLIYLLYSFFCHQFSERSLHIFDNQIAWCARDLGIWLGWLLAVAALKFHFIKPIKFKFLPLFILPIALDGGIQTIFTVINLDQNGQLTKIVYLSNNFTRVTTGLLFGIGIVLWGIPYVRKIMNYELRFDFLRLNIFRILMIFVTGILIYIFLIQLWNLTSKTIKPTNWLDSNPKSNSDNFFERRKDGECPTNKNDLFNFNCLLN